MAEMNLKLGATVDHGTNILSYKVPNELRRRVRTGVEWWDDALDGGHTPSTAMLYTGMPGAGKTRSCMQVADAITARGHICLYNTNEESVAQLAMTCEKLQLRHGFVVGNDYLMPKVIEHCQALQRKAKGKKAKDGTPVQVFLICDSLQTMDDGKYSNGHTTGNTPMHVLEQFCNWCKSKNSGAYGVGVMIGHVTKSGEFAGKQALKHMIDAHVHLRIDEDPKSDTCGKRLFSVRKNRFGAGKPAYVLSMKSKGLVEDGSF